MSQKIENNLICFGFRLGILAMLVAFLLLFVAALGLCELQPVVFWIVGLAIGGAVSTFVSKRRWNKKFHAELPVPCLHCSEEFTASESSFGSTFRDRNAEVVCPHCRKTMEY